MKFTRPIGITFIYLILGLMWITTSDQIAVMWFSDNLTELASFQIIKGILFILITALILYLLIRRLYRELATYKEDLNLLFSNPKLGILKLRPDGNIIYASATLHKMLGYKKERLTEKSFREITHPGDLELVEYYFKKVKSGVSETFNYEKRFLSTGGKSIWVEVNGIAKRTDDATDYIILAIENISDRRESQEVLAQELREKNALINNTDDLIWSVDGDLQIVSYNNAFTEAVNHANGQHISKGDSALIRSFGSAPLNRWRQYYARALSGDNFMVVEETENSDYTKYSHINFHPIRQDGKTVGVSCFARDITDKVIARKKLKEREEYLEVLTNHASDAIIACDEGGYLQYYNETMKKWCGNEEPVPDLTEWPEKYGLYTVDENRLLKKEELSIVKALREEKLRNYEFVIKRRDAYKRYIQANGSALYNAENRKIGAMVVLRDITDRMDQDIQTSNKIISTLEDERASIASELHDGITQLLGIVSMNLKNFALEHPEIKDNARIKNAREQLHNAIESSRSMAHRIMPKSIQDFGLVISIQELVDDLRKSNAIDVEFTYNEDNRLPIEIELNVYRIIQEAIKNTIKHAEASQLNIHLNFAGKRLKARVRDNGCGFNPEETNYLGIGLRTMKYRAKKLNAKFNIHTSSKGTIIDIDIPVN